MDVIDLVKKDHDHVEELFARFKGGGGLTGLVRRATGNVTARERRTAVQSICRELDLHARLEEEILYPAVRATGDGELNRLVQESEGEHARIKEHVRALRDGTLPDEEVDRRMGELEQCVQHHVGEEENEMLPRFEQLVPEAEREQLGRRMQAGKRSATPRRPAATARRTRRTAARTRTTRARARARRTSVAAKRSRPKKRARRSQRK